MNDEKDDRKPIEPPGTDKKRTLVRTVAEGVVGLVPGGSIATGIVRVTNPPTAEQDREAWQRDISQRTNEHDERLNRHAEELWTREKVSGTTARLVATLVRDCPDGLGQKHYSLDAIVELFPGEDRQELEDAAYELEAYGLVNIHRNLNGPWHLSLTPEAYAQLDHQVMDWDMASDAVEIARLMLAEDTGNAPTLHVKTGWARRRFNPALAYLLPLFPEGRIRRVLQLNYVTLGVVFAPEDKVRLRGFITRYG